MVTITFKLKKRGDKKYTAFKEKVKTVAEAKSLRRFLGREAKDIKIIARKGRRKRRTYGMFDFRGL